MSRTVALAVVLVLLTPLTSRAQDVGSCATERSRFIFRSGFWLNLHNFLHRAAKERRGINDEVPAAMTVAAHDTARNRALDPAERDAWERALQVYLSYPMALGRTDSVVSRLNERLAAAADEGELGDVDVDPTVRRALLAAAPVYRAVWWNAHDRRNRAWIASLQPRLASQEACLVRFVTRALAADFPAGPIMVDASVYASWFGTYMTQPPVHITMSSNARGNQGSVGLEGLLHEAGHAMLGPIESALVATAAREGRMLPPELAHLILFYTAGEAVRTVAPGHVPYAERFGVWTQNATAERYRVLLEREWRPHLEGRRTFAEAVARVVERLPRRPV